MPLVKKPGKIVKRPAARRASRLEPMPPLQDPTVVNFYLAPQTKQYVRIGSECSGFCPEAFASEKALGPSARIVHVFASDSRTSVRAFSTRFVTPLHLYRDIRTWSAPGNLDVYLAGFPCHPFSLAGLMQGTADHLGRGNIVEQVLLYIQSSLPRAFILENVSGLVKGFASIFSAIIHSLPSVRTSTGDLAYTVHWRELSTKDEGGLPQNRPRMYSVGVLRAEMRRPFVWPGKARNGKTLHEVLEARRGDAKDLEELTVTAKQNIYRSCINMLEQGQIHDEANAVIVMGGPHPHIMYGNCPCITKTRGAGLGFWSTCLQRALTINDLLRLQGADPDAFVDWEDTSSRRQLGTMVGNAMSFSVVERLLRNIFNSLGYDTTVDPWA